MPRIVIQVNKDSLADAKVNQPREIIEYRWDRIIPALLILFLLIAAIVWGLVRVLEPATGESVLGELPIVADREIHQAAPEQSVPAEEAAPPVEQSTAIVEESPAAEPSPAEVASRTVPEETVSQAEPEPVVQQPAATFPPSRVKLYTNRIRNAQLTSQVVDRKAVDQLPSVLHMNEEGLLRVYLVTETVGLEERTLFHNWYLNGKRVARVQLPGVKKPTSLYSSKFIDRHMTGTWTVKVVDDRNQLLADTTFEVRR